MYGQNEEEMCGQNVPSAAAFVRKVLVVSKLIWRNGEAHSFIPSLFIALYEPVRVMQSAIKDRWRALTSIPQTPNTPDKEIQKNNDIKLNQISQNKREWTNENKKEIGISRSLCLQVH